jgi:serine protease AprX
VTAIHGEENTMATRLITAFYMHENERDAAAESMASPVVTEAFVYGEIEEDRIEGLEKQGLIIEVHDVDDEPDEVDPPPPAPDLSRFGEASVGDLSALGGDVSFPPPQPAPADPAGFYVLRLRRPLMPDDQRRLEEMGVEVIERVNPVRRSWEPPDARAPGRPELKVYLEHGQAGGLRAMDFARAVYLYGPSQTSVLASLPGDDTEAPARDGPAEGGPGVGASVGDIVFGIPGAPPPRTYDVILHRPADERPEDREAVLQWMRDRGVPVLGTSPWKVRVEMDPTLESEVRAIREVESLDEYVEPELLNDQARRLLGVDPPGEGVAGIPQTGRGQIVGIADTGIDETHQDFAGRIKKVFARGRPGDASDPHGHGTHVAGSVVGTGVASGGAIRGVAPEAEIVFQSIRGDDGKLKLPVDLGDLLREAYDEGARIHNNSWGTRTGSQYRSTSFDVDDFVWRNRDMLVVIAAGNEGTAKSPIDPPRVGKGFPDWLSISAPATAKNALVVGASRGSRKSGGWAADTWNERWPERFALPDGIAGETVSGDPERLAGFSSRGPCMDDRVKPDVVAPGTDILSTRAATAGTDTPLDEVFWGEDPDRPGYAYMGGTSMAAPLVAGCAALVRQWYVEDRAHEPSAALLKATIINGTRWLGGPDALEGHPKTPNFHQGFGAVHMPTTIPNPGNPGMKLAFFDPWKDQGRWLQDRLARSWDLQVSAGTPLRICLTYTDLARSGVQNRLNLFVDEVDGPNRWVGNQDLPFNPKRVPDPYNNVQVVRVDAPAAGEYRIKVTATSLVKPQDFALVVTGDFTGTLA